MSVNRSILDAIESSSLNELNTITEINPVKIIENVIETVDIIIIMIFAIYITTLIAEKGGKSIVGKIIASVILNVFLLYWQYCQFATMPYYGWNLNEEPPASYHVWVIINYIMFLILPIAIQIVAIFKIKHKKK